MCSGSTNPIPHLHHLPLNGEGRERGHADKGAQRASTGHSIKTTASSGLGERRRQDAERWEELLGGPRCWRAMPGTHGEDGHVGEGRLQTVVTGPVGM